ncbi:hypothetical protein MMC12_005098 [Toensbergia leucococca]|nr:hypothetical protein [Toensbergia leucococca]
MVDFPQETSALDTHSSPSDADSSKLIEALDKRRKLLNQEVDDFKAKKDHEYQTFEHNLRRAVESGHGQEDRLQHVHDGTRDRTNDQSEIRGIDQGFLTIKRPEDAVSIANPDGHAAGDSHVLALTKPSTSPFQKSSIHSLARTPLHERELEFRGLFTPDYLPLIDPIVQPKLPTSSETSSSSAFKPDNGEVESDETLLRHASENSFALSPHSSVPNRPLSTSLPHSKPPHQRRSSFRSDTSVTSLRSSLRDPSQPRLPKRVLFSIDDIVVSPSTSPIAQRPSKLRPSHLHTFPRLLEMPARDKVAGSEIKAGNFVSYSGDNVDKPTLDASNVTRPSAFDAGLSNSTSSRRSVKPTNPSPMTGGPIVGGDDFEHVDADDALFTFDEDLDLGEAEDKGEDDMVEDIESEDDGGNDEMLPVSSPHVGSLPIEIRWPVKHDPRN